MEKKERFLQHAQQMGYDLYACQDFLENRGIYEADPLILVENLQNPSYFNVLRVNRMVPQ